MAYQQENAKKKGMREYRSLLTREAYERDPAKCAKAIDNIINGAVNLDPVCVKAFSQSYMTKAPAEEQQMSVSIGLTKEKSQRLLDFYLSQGLEPHAAAQRLVEFGELLNIVKDGDEN